MDGSNGSLATPTYCSYGIRRHLCATAAVQLSPRIMSNPNRRDVLDEDSLERMLAAAAIDGYGCEGRRDPTERLHGER